MLMPMGRYAGQPVEAMSTSYLCWLVSSESMRWNRWPLTREALAVLRERFRDFACLEASMRVTEKPPDYWKAGKHDRKAEKAEKLRQLEAVRAAERERRRAEAEHQREERKREYRRDMRAAILAEEQARVQHRRPTPGVPLRPEDLA